MKGGYNAGKGQPKMRHKQNQGKGFKKKKPTAKSVDKKVKKILASQELKYFDEYNNNSSVSLTTSGYAFTINNFATGNTRITRIGNQISLTSLQLKYTLITAAGLLSGFNTRVLVVYDRNHNNSGNSFDGNPINNAGIGLLDNTVIPSAPLMPRNIAYQKRYKVLYDKNHFIRPEVNTAAASTIPTGLTVYKNIKLSGRKSVYDGSGGSVADINVGAVSIFIVPDVSNVVFASVGTRLYFKDD